jgi:tetratricopeptide (TPR) repeat protein
MLNPDVAQFYFDLGTTYNNSFGPRQEAIDAFKMAIIIKPDYAEAHYGLGKTYVQIGNRDSALEQYKILKTLDEKLANELLGIMNQKKLTYSQKMRREIEIIEVLLLIALLLIFPATQIGGDIWLSILWIWLLIIGIAVHNLIIYTELVQKNEKTEPVVDEPK